MFFAYNFLGLNLYALFLLSSVLCVICFNVGKIKKTNAYGYLVIASCAVMVLVTISFMLVYFLRDYYAPDNENYLSIYSRLISYGEVRESISYDYGYVFLLYVLNAVGVTDEYFLEFCFLIIFLVFLCTIIKLSDSLPVLFILFITCVFSWSILDLLTNTHRQGISLALITSAFAFRKHDESNGTFKFISAIIISASFHWTGYLFLSIVLFSKFLRNSSSRLIYFVSLAFFALNVFVTNVTFSILVSVLDYLSVYIAQLKVLSEKFHWYISTGVSPPLILRVRISLDFLIFNLFSCFILLKPDVYFSKNEVKKLQCELALLLLVSSLITWSEYSFRVYNLFVPYMFYIYARFLNVERKRVGVFNLNSFVFIIIIFLVAHVTFWRSGILFQLYRGEVW